MAMTVAGLRATAAGRLRKYGCRCELVREDGNIDFYGSLQPRFYEIARTGTPMGLGDTDRFLLYAAVDKATAGITRHDSIVCYGRRYQVRRVEPYCCAGKPVYLKILPHGWEDFSH
mgnify:CR=1 FL=1